MGAGKISSRVYSKLLDDVFLLPDLRRAMNDSTPIHFSSSEMILWQLRRCFKEKKELIWYDGITSLISFHGLRGRLNQLVYKQ